MIAADAVRDLWERSGLTKSELCLRSGVSRALFDDYLKGRRQPGVRQLERLGRAADLRPTITWTLIDRAGRDRDSWVTRGGPATPAWTRPQQAMAAEPLTVQERAQVLERVVAVGMSLQRRARGELMFPPFRTLRKVAR